MRSRSRLPFFRPRCFQAKEVQPAGQVVGDLQHGLPVPQPFDQVRQEDAGSLESAEQRADLGGPLKERALTLEASWPEARNLTTDPRLKGAKKAGAVLEAKADETYTGLYPWPGSFAGTGRRWRKSPSS